MMCLIDPHTCLDYSSRHYSILSEPPGRMDYMRILWTLSGIGACVLLVLAIGLDWFGFGTMLGDSFVEMLRRATGL